MKIAIIGSGAAGSGFAGYLKKGGAEDITLVDPYKEHMETVARDGLLFRNPDGEFLLHGFKTACSAESIGIMDIVIIMVKTTQTAAAMETAMPCIGPETVVCTLQNGLGNDEKIKPFVPADRILFGCGNMGNELSGPGVCVAKPMAGENIYFGPCEKSALTDRAGLYLEKCFAAGGLQPKYYDDVRPKVWRKATSNSGFNTVCAVLRMKVREVYDDPNGVQLVWDIWHEAADVAEALGIPGIWDFMQTEMGNLIKNIGDYYPSMAQDFQRRRQTEVDSLTGAIAMYGKQVGVPTPTCDVITRQIKAIEANYEKMFAV